MARIRTIKPEFFTSADIVCMTPLSRLFYASLWCESDREGRLKWDVKTLKLRYFPADDCDIEAMGNELVENGLIVIYEIEGKQYAEIPSFNLHQIINNREAESTIPENKKVSEHSQTNDASFTRESGVQGEGKEGREGKGRRVKEKRETLLPEDFAISDAVRSWADSNGHGDLDQHLANFIDSCRAKGYKYVDWDAAFRNAIAKNWAKVTPKLKQVSGALPEFMRGAL